MESESAQKPQPYTVLCVDGDVRSLRLLEVGLRQAGYRVLAVQSADEALLLPATELPDAMFVAAELADLDGFTLVQRLRLYPGWGTVPALFLVEHDRPSQRLRAYELGGEALHKPLFLKEALARVEVLLEKAALRGDPVAGQASQPRFAGYLDGTSLIDLLQSMEIGRRTGVATCQRAQGQPGYIYFADGKVVDAEVGPLRGEEALFRLLTWRGGSFVLDEQQVSRADRIALSSSGLILEVARRLDDWNRLQSTLPPLSTVLMQTTAGATLPESLPAELQDVLHSFDGKRTLLEVIELDHELPLDSLGRLDAVAKLHAARLLLPRRPPSGEPSLQGIRLTPAPRLTPVPRLTPPPRPAPAARLTPPLPIPRPTPSPGSVPAARLTPPPVPMAALAPRLTPSPAQVMSLGATRTPPPLVGQAALATAYAPTPLPMPSPFTDEPSRISAEHAAISQHSLERLSLRLAETRRPTPLDHLTSAVTPEGSPALTAAQLSEITDPGEPPVAELSSSDGLQPLSDPSVAQAAVPVAGQTIEHSAPVLPAAESARTLREPLPIALRTPVSSTEKSDLVSIPDIDVRMVSEQSEPSLPKRPAELSLPSTPAIPAVIVAAQPEPQRTSGIGRLIIIGAGLFALGAGMSWFRQDPERPLSAPTTSAPAPVPSTPPPAPAAPTPTPAATASVPSAAPVPSEASTAGTPLPAPAAPTPEPTAAPTPAAPVESATPAAPPTPTPTPTAQPLEPAAAAAPDEYQQLIEKGRQYLRKGKPNQAQSVAQKAMRLRPQGGAEALVLLAELAVDEGDADRAERLATRAAKLNPADPDVYVVLGTVEQARANSAKARSYFKRYLALSPNGPHAKDVRAILRMVP